MKTELNKNHIGVKNLIKDVKHKCKVYGVDLILSSGKSVNITDTIKVGGYFSDESDGDKPILACAMGQPNFEKAITLLLHESSHLDQWQEKSDLWMKSSGISIIDEWLDGKNVDSKKLELAFKTSIDIELDCEKRTIKKIIKYKIPINVEEYKQRSNAYILFYNYVKKHRKWSIPGNPPYGDKIFPHAPKRWLNNYYDYIPKKLERAYDLHLGLI
jgi:hypothetical protein